MDIRKILPAMRWIFTRVGFVYISLLVGLAFIVDGKAAESRVKMRRLNDARPPMNELVSLAKGEIQPKAIHWKPLRRYFELVLRYMPDEWTARMFQGVCAYYQGDAIKALVDIRRSADAFPPLFWNSYNAAILTFLQGDMRLTLVYIEQAMRMPPQAAAVALRSSVIYRQIMSSGNFDIDSDKNMDLARQELAFLSVAAYYYAKDFAQSRTRAMQVIGTPGSDEAKEPFYFYAGAASLALGDTAGALSSLGHCIKLRSRNPLVYRYAGDILASAGKLEEGHAWQRTADLLQKENPSGFPYADHLRLRFM